MLFIFLEIWFLESGDVGAWVIVRLGFGFCYHELANDYDVCELWDVL